MPTNPPLTDEERKELFEESWPKTCSCGEVITEEKWEKLDYCGVQRVPPDYGLPDMELRNCGRCGSTIAVVVPNDFV